MSIFHWGKAADSAPDVVSRAPSDGSEILGPHVIYTTCFSGPRPVDKSYNNWCTSYNPETTMLQTSADMHKGGAAIRSFEAIDASSTGATRLRAKATPITNRDSNGHCRKGHGLLRADGAVNWQPYRKGGMPQGRRVREKVCKCEGLDPTSTNGLIIYWTNDISKANP